MPKKYITLKVPLKIKNKLDRNHFEKEGWTNIYWYKKRLRTQCKMSFVDNDVISGECYRSDTLYKVSQLSKKGMWDYYKILKPQYREPIIAKQAKSVRKNDVNIEDVIDTTDIPHEFGFQKSVGKFIISFD